jgi:hypothetical protein
MNWLHWTTGMLIILATGLFWGTWFSLSRSIDHFSPENFIDIGKTIIHNVAIPMSIIMPAAILGMVILLWYYRKRRSSAFYYMLAALVLFILALLITVGIEVPIDNQIKTWTATTVPPNFETLRARWQLFHTLRTFLSLASTGLFLAASKPIYQ